MTIKSALISVYTKTGLQPIVEALNALNISLYATGGSFDFIKALNIPVVAVEDVTDYPSILGGRVKTLHPKIFGGILSRRDHADDVLEAEKFDIPAIDCVIVDLYPFEQTVAAGASEADIIEKIDIGGVSLIRAAAKNFKHVVIVPAVRDFAYFLKELQQNKGNFSHEARSILACHAFEVTSHYDTAIYRYFNRNNVSPQESLQISVQNGKSLRYGENPHQQGSFFGNLHDVFEQLNGKELSYNNLLDCDAALNLIAEFKDEPGATVAVIKHNNACGLASRNTVLASWEAALAGDPVSAFGGIIVSNTAIDETAAQAMHALFFEVLIAPAFDDKALALLKEKKNRIILKLNKLPENQAMVRTALNGFLVQDKDVAQTTSATLQQVTEKKPTTAEINDLLFANKLVRQTKSNAIILVKNKQLIGSGAGQTSRIDALEQAITKAQHFGFKLEGAVMASDAFFPFPDCVEIAHKAGITAIIQPGGSIKDKDSIDYCNKNSISMVLTGNRHFKH